MSRAEINSVGVPSAARFTGKSWWLILSPGKEKLCRDCQARLDRNPLRVLDCKTESCREITAEAPKITDFLCD